MWKIQENEQTQEVENRGIKDPTKRTDVLQEFCFKKKLY